jgi:hypothetical protein
MITGAHIPDLKMNQSLFIIVVLLLSFSAVAADIDAKQYKGRTLISVIDEFRSDGFGLAYSNSLVSDTLVVTVEPTATADIQILKQILEPHNLTIRSEGAADRQGQAGLLAARAADCQRHASVGDGQRSGAGNPAVLGTRARHISYRGRGQRF